MNTEHQSFAVTQQQLEQILHSVDRLVRHDLAYDSNSALVKLSADLSRIENKLRHGTFKVAVLALAKSGKSTLINAFLGEEYLPSANTPETARIVSIRCTGEAAVLEDGDRRVEGVSRINAYLRTLNKNARDSQSKTLRDLVLKAPLAWIGEADLGPHQFEILDTPGANEEGAIDLHRQVVQVLEDADAIIYILDYTKLKTIDEANLLKLLKELRPELLERCSERLFFVLNKVDTADRNSASLDETKEYVRNLLARTFGNLNVRAGRIIPVGAKDALLSRLILTTTPSAEVVADFGREAFGKLLGAKATLEQCLSGAPVLLENSNLPHLEREMLQYIFKNRGRLLHQSVADELQRAIGELANYYTTSLAAHQVGIVELESKLASLKVELSHVLEGLSTIAGEGERVKSDVEKWVRTRFQVFSAQVRPVIEDMLGDAIPETRPGFIRAAWQAIHNLVVGEASDREDVMARINAVNTRIDSILDFHFIQFQSELEQEAYQKQIALLKDISERLAPLAQKVEQKVNQALEISLAPVSIQMPIGSLREFQDEMRERTRHAVRASIRIEKRTEVKTKRVRGSGWCAPTRTVDVPVTSDVVVTRHHISREELMTHWQGHIQSLTEHSVETALSVLDEVFYALTKRAHAQFEAYASSFVRAIEQEIKESELGQEQRAQRLRELKRRRGASAALMAAIRSQSALLASSPQVNEPPVAASSLHVTDSVDLAIVTVLPEEFGAVWALLENCRLDQRPDIVNAHAEHIGELRSPHHKDPYRAVLAMAGVPGGIPTAMTVNSVARRYSPKYIILCGIAGGLGGKLKRGDVVIARTVSLYEYGKLNSTFAPRPEMTYPADKALLTAAETLKPKGLLESLAAIRRPPALEGETEVDVGAVLSGDKVVDDIDNPLFRDVLRVWPTAVAVEMEGAGAGWAVHGLRAERINAGFLMIRGISDIPKSSSSSGSSSSGTQARDEAKIYAASVAAAFVVALVQHAWPVSPERKN